MVGASGAALLASSLASGGSSLLRLDLWDASVGELGVGALAAALPKCQLQLLGLWGTPFGDGHDDEDDDDDDEDDETEQKASTGAFPYNP